ncbi:hypothetical protein CR162_21185 [Pseudoroseomonas rhizosphaerae]|uniref:DUF2971 domain-containing protein n=1 Tax=Teichococcus rhizosphaerae TaxID=1335062 RepID=A0A2C6ZYQ8_9PROT|nr:DUF2971 domain-containing protein [Pseudoroseomonas rhizosphaerae]PHK92948.1 hypothetical protein CR162_21185 [Pseudoroseomonas rhizosphaerae]
MTKTMSASEEDTPYLYKYRSMDGSARDRTRSIFSDNKLWFAQASDFNDPFDSAPGFSVEAPAPTFLRYIEKLFKKKGGQVLGADKHALRARLREIQREPQSIQKSPDFVAEMRRATALGVNQAGVLSLSARPDAVLMWSHYASSHTGICLRFRATEGIIPFRAAQRIVYQAERPVLNPVFDEPDAIMAKTFLTKADFWQYEEEWRVISHPGSPVNQVGGYGAMPFDPDALDGVIFGCKARQRDIDDVRSWVAGRKQPVELLRAVSDPDFFRLDIVSLGSG